MPFTLRAVIAAAVTSFIAFIDFCQAESASLSCPSCSATAGAEAAS